MSELLAIAGGSPIRPQGYPEWPVFDTRDEAQLLAVLRSGRWGGFPEPGPYNAQFCEQFAAFQGSKYGILMVNGTVTMEVALIVPIAMEEKLRFAIREGGRTVGAGVVASIIE